MTPHKINKRGSFVLDRQFRGVGRIKRATGTSDPALFKLVDAMLGTLAQAGRIDILQAIKSGALTPLEVWSRFRLGELDRLPTVETMVGLKSALEEWQGTAEASDWHRASRKYSVAAILRLARKDATIQDLPNILREYRKKAKGAPTFNRTRAAMMAFVRDTIDQSHPIYARLKGTRIRKETARAGNPQTPAQLAALAAKLHAAHAAIAWSMALTGMGPGELWGQWTQQKDRIHIRGTKREGRVRDIPLVRPISRPTRTYRSFLEAVGAASDETVRPYDLRKTFANWMEEAGIPRTRRKMYLGHGKTDVTDLYERHDVERFLAEDGEKLRAFLGDTPTQAGLRLAR